MTTRDDWVCQCGHPFVAHEHLRQGTDCALCFAGACRRFRRSDGVLERVVAKLVPWLRHEACAV